MSEQKAKVCGKRLTKLSWFINLKSGEKREVITFMPSFKIEKFRCKKIGA